MKITHFPHSLNLEFFLAFVWAINSGHENHLNNFYEPAFFNK